MCTRYWRHAPSSCFQKKSSPRGFTGSRKSVCPVIFKRKITLRPVIFLIIKSLRPVIYGVQKSIRPAVSWPALFPINFANSLSNILLSCCPTLNLLQSTETVLLFSWSIPAMYHWTFRLLSCQLSPSHLSWWRVRKRQLINQNIQWTIVHVSEWHCD